MTNVGGAREWLEKFVLSQKQLNLRFKISKYSDLRFQKFRNFPFFGLGTLPRPF